MKLYVLIFVIVVLSYAQYASPRRMEVGNRRANRNPIGLKKRRTEVAIFAHLLTVLAKRKYCLLNGLLFSFCSQIKCWLPGLEFTKWLSE